MRLHGSVRVADARHTVADATVTVRLLDVSRADAAATTVAETTIRGCALEAGSPATFPFTLDAPALDPRATYSLAARVSTTGSTEISVGDYITTRHLPVTEQDDGRAFDVPLQPVD